MTSPLPLADNFPVFTEEDWHAVVVLARRGGGESKLEAGPVLPRRAGAHAIAGRLTGQPWRIVQRLDSNDGSPAEDIAGGATGFEIVFSSSLHPLRSALPEKAASSIASSLAAAVPDGFHLRVEAGEATEAIAGPFLDLATARRAELVLAFDPIAAMAVRGASAWPIEQDAGTIKATAKIFDERGIGGAAVIADGRLWHASGATDEQELAATLATFVGYLRLLDAEGRIGVALAADADQFRGIAKFRAMRLLLARVGEVAGLSASLPRIHGETAWRTMAALDPQMNILRATSGAFAAAVGGADSITVLPFDAVAAVRDSHGRRLARNTQTILAEEARVFRVADPGAGSGTIEAMTTAVAEAAWKRFQAIEAAGGIVAAIGEGSLLREIADAREGRLARVASGEMQLIGVNAYTAEATTARIHRAPVSRAATMVFKRLSEPLEGGQ